MATSIGRRHALRAALAACPEDSAKQGGIDWTPDIMHPVAAGFQDLDLAQGAPGPVRVWYPTCETFIDGPPRPRKILKHCLARYLPVAASKTLMPLSLIPEPAPPTPRQLFYGGNRLWSLEVC